MPRSFPLKDPGWLPSYLGLPFKDRGLDRKGIHCWGLIRLAFMEQHGIVLPAYGEASEAGVMAIARAVRRDSEMPPWRRVPLASEQSFDVVVMAGAIEEAQSGRVFRAPVHVGLVTKPAHLLHIEKHINSVHVAFRDGPRVRANLSLFNRVLAVFRHGALA